MLLYHFTAHDRLGSIMEAGLNKGDVPLSETTGMNAVWLTTDPAPDGHGLDAAGVLDDAARYTMLRLFGELPPEGSRWSDKTAVRITVRLPSGDRNLKDWLPWARKRASADWLSRLHSAAGGHRKARTWKLYFGVVPPSAFVAVDILRPDGEGA